MYKLVILLIIYGAYIAVLFRAQQIATCRAVAISMTILSFALVILLLMGGLVFIGSILAALTVAALVAAIANGMIWIPYIIRSKHMH